MSNNALPDAGRNGPAAARLPGAVFVRRVLVVAAFLVVALLFWNLRHVVLLAFGSILIACALRGIAGPIRKLLPIGKGLAIGLALLLVVSVLAGMGLLFGSQISGQLDTLMQTLPAAFERVQQRIAQTGLGQAAIEQLQADVDRGGIFAGIAGQIGAFGMSLASAALDGFIVIVAGVFLALGPKLYREGLLRLFPRNLWEGVRTVLDHSGEVLKKWLLGTLVSIFAMTLMITGGLWALGVPAPLALGLLAGIAQFVPFVGPIVAAIPGILIAFTVSPATAAFALVLYFAASTIEANILYPLIQKKAVEQPPVITLYSVIAFGLLFGPLGVLLAVPITLVITVIVIVFYVRGVLQQDVHLPGA